MAKKPLEVGVCEVEIKRLEPGDNRRKFFPGLVELAQLIRQSGRVVPLTADVSGRIIDGERRYRACCLLNEEAKKKKEPLPWPRLTCEVIEATDEQKRDWNVQANLGRENYRFIELARIFQEYRDAGKTNAEISTTTGFSEDTVSAYLAVLHKVSPDIIARLDNGELIQASILIRLKSIKDHDVQKLRLEQWLGNPVTESETEAKTSRQRVSMLSRRKLMALIKLLQQSEAEKETVEVALYIAGLRQTLPHKWHLRLSRHRNREPSE